MVLEPFNPVYGTLPFNQSETIVKVSKQFTSTAHCVAIVGARVGRFVSVLHRHAGRWTWKEYNMKCCNSRAFCFCRLGC